MSVEKQLRKAINDSELTHYAIGKRARVAVAIIDRFVAGTADIRVSNVSKLCDFLGLELCRIAGATAGKQSADGKRSRSRKRQAG